MAKPTQRELDLGYCEEAQTYCSVAEDRYKQGRADATKELPTSLYCDGFNDGYEKGRADKYQEIISEYMLLTEEQVAEIRADSIEELKKEFVDIVQGNEEFIDWQKQEIILYFECAIENVKEQK